MDAITTLPDGTRLMLLAPLVQGRKGEYKHIFEDVRRAGYVRVRVDGEVRDVSEEIELDKYKTAHDRSGGGSPGDPPCGSVATAERVEWQRPSSVANLKLVAEQRSGYVADSEQPEVDPETSQRSRVTDSVETTLKLGNGIILVSIIDGEERLYSERFACVYCGIEPGRTGAPQL